MKIKKTQRGFRIAQFKDQKGIECSIQKSSLAEIDCIWLGANKLGISEFVAYRQPNAWEERPEFDESSMAHHFVGNNRMHLSRKDVRKLLPILQRFVETGEI